jgi:hypothetical protein
LRECSPRRCGGLVDVLLEAEAHASGGTTKGRARR